LTPVFI
jgi:predicted  nucleic acid-binding Zn-ribbon protein